MSTKSRQTIYGGAIIGAEILAEGAREAAKKAIREADRTEAEAWSIRMEGPPDSDQTADIAGGPFRANKRLVHRSEEHRYSITSSAIASTPGGMFRPSALAALRLITSSNLVGCTTGRS